MGVLQLLQLTFIMYADDVVNLSSFVSGMSELIQVCRFYWLNHDITYNSKKRRVLICKSKYIKNIDVP